MINSSSLHCVDSQEELDQEWVQLFIEAKKLGVTLEDIQKFLVKNTLIPESQ
ncbi:anti-repressor SinI family protein [Ferdinandcohnia sp. Marseille-Q9671]